MKNKLTFFLTCLILLNLPVFYTYSTPGDTTWVTTFDQEFHNWANLHYKPAVFPDTTHHWQKILMTYKIGCPAAGCDPWDRVGWIRLYTDTVNVNYFEIARVVTPYNIVGGGYPGTCTFLFDVTDYMPLLHDNVLLGSYIESWIGGNKGWLVTAKFAFIEGEAYYKPYKVINLWQNDYIVSGDTANLPESHLLPVNLVIDSLAMQVKTKITNTGHGQGNTGNCSEFCVLVNSVVANNDTTTHILWKQCNLNPCSPQGGTWQYARAGWCPGSGVPPWDVDITTSVTPGQNANLKFLIQPYVNECRPTNPNCTTGVTCADCNYNSTGHTEPNWKVQGQIVYFKLNPIGINNQGTQLPVSFKLEQNFPNPFNPITSISFSLEKNQFVKLIVYDAKGSPVKTLVDKHMIAGIYTVEFDGQNFASGVYFYKIEVGNKSDTRKMILIK